MRKYLLTLFFALSLSSPGIVLGNDTSTAEQAITPYLAPGISLGEVQTAPMCGTLAAKAESGALFWILSGNGKSMPFAVNGAAKAMVPNIFWAPPTVSATAVEKAFAGKPLEKPANHLHMLWALFPKRIDEAAKAQGLPPLQAEGYYGRKLVCKSGQRAMLQFQRAHKANTGTVVGQLPEAAPPAPPTGLPSGLMPSLDDFDGLGYLG